MCLIVCDVCGDWTGPTGKGWTKDSTIESKKYGHRCCTKCEHIYEKWTKLEEENRKLRDELSVIKGAAKHVLKEAVLQIGDDYIVDRQFLDKLWNDLNLKEWNIETSDDYLTFSLLNGKILILASDLFQECGRLNPNTTPKIEKLREAITERNHWYSEVYNKEYSSIDKTSDEVIEAILKENL